MLNRIRMCRMKKLGRRQRYDRARYKLGQELPRLRKKAETTRARSEKKRLEKERHRAARMHWRVMAKDDNLGRTRVFIGN